MDEHVHKLSAHGCSPEPARAADIRTKNVLFQQVAWQLTHNYCAVARSQAVHMLPRASKTKGCSAAIIFCSAAEMGIPSTADLRRDSTPVEILPHNQGMMTWISCRHIARALAIRGLWRGAGKMIDINWLASYLHTEAVCLAVHNMFS